MGTMFSKVTRNVDAYIETIPPGALLTQLQDSIPFPFTMARPAPAVIPGSGAALDTQIRVVNVDCLVSARDLVKSGSRNVAILNMANEWNCGGAFSVSIGSQEEYLFRNTTLGLSLWRGRRQEQWVTGGWVTGTRVTGPPCVPPLYPFPECGGVYTLLVDVRVELRLRICSTQRVRA